MSQQPFVLPEKMANQFVMVIRNVQLIFEYLCFFNLFIFRFVGDSGGPLIDTNENALIGLASFIHPKKNCTDYPQGFTIIALYREWISEITGLT